MTFEENLLVILMEECAETSQRASKAIRFTLPEVQPDQELTNAERIVYEFNDILAVMELLFESGAINKVVDQGAIDIKKAKIKKYLEYSQSLGTVESEETEEVEHCENCGCPLDSFEIKKGVWTAGTSPHPPPC